MEKLNLEKLEFRNKLCIVRCDFNVPLKDGKVCNDYRIRKTLPTIEYMRVRGARIVLISHLGRPNGRLFLNLRLEPIACRLSSLLNIEVKYAKDCIGPNSKALIARMKSGEVILLENLRFHNAEIKNEDTFAKELSHGADYFINDAFGVSHRAHASNSGITKFVKASAMGFLLQREIKYLNQIVEKPTKPLVAICGGAKIATKIKLLQKLIASVDFLLIGGGMCFTFLKAQGYEVGFSIVDERYYEIAEEMLTHNANKIKIPKDFMITSSFDPQKMSVGELKRVAFDQIPKDCCALDIGRETLTSFTQVISQAKTIFWNGPMGVFEIDKTAQGTYEMARAVGQSTKNGATSIIGGGDSIDAVEKTGFKDEISHISTGGGATLAFIVSPHQPGIVSLSESSFVNAV